MVFGVRMVTKDELLGKIGKFIKEHPDCISDETLVDLQMRQRAKKNLDNVYLLNVIDEIYQNLELKEKSKKLETPIAPIVKKRTKFVPKNPNDNFEEKKIKDVRIGDKIILNNVEITKFFPPHYYWICRRCSQQSARSNRRMEIIITPNQRCPNCGELFLTCPTCGVDSAIIRGVCTTCNRIYYRNSVVFRFMLEDETGRIFTKTNSPKSEAIVRRKTIELMKLITQRRLDMEAFVGIRFDMAGDIVEKKGMKIFRPIWFNRLS